MRPLILALAMTILSVAACAHDTAVSEPRASAPPLGTSRTSAHDAPTCDELLRLRFPDDYRGPSARGFRELHDDPRVASSTLPPELRLELGALETRADRLVLDGELVNASTTAYEIVVNGDVFSLVLEPNDAVTPKPYDGPPRPPPVPPPPMLLEVPARSRIALRAEVYLPDWNYAGAPEVRLRWAFEAWNPPRPSGEITATLPRR